MAGRLVEAAVAVAAHPMHAEAAGAVVVAPRDVALHLPMYVDSDVPAAAVAVPRSTPAQLSASVG